MNRIVEQCISFISTWMLIMLLHAQLQWPQMITKSFWPFATHHTVNIYEITIMDAMVLLYLLLRYEEDEEISVLYQ